MNKNLVLIGATLALSLTLVGCNKSGKLDEPSTFKTPTGPVELKLKFPQGERIVQDMDLKQTSSNVHPGPARAHGTGHHHGNAIRPHGVAGHSRWRT